MVKKRIIIRYTLLQLPALVLLILVLVFIQRWVGIPAWAFYGIIIVWVLKDIILFRYTWRAYDRDDQNPLVGALGIARDRLAPSGYVIVGNELWQAEVAEGSPPVEEGTPVRIMAVRGLTLLVEPDKERDS